MKITLQKPLKEWYITQLFAKNNVSWYKEYGLKGHNGIDFRCAVGTPIFATHDGTCIGVYEDSAGGIGIDIVDPTGKFKTRYWHIMKGGVIVAYGQKVKAGDVIAMSGNTGRSTGPHLHFGLKEVKNINGVWVTLNKDNGFFGGINPMDYFDIPFYMKFGMVENGFANDGVAVLQAILFSRGYNIKIDGSFGRKTKTIVKEFQKRNGLVSDGVVGENTWKELLNNSAL